MISVIIPHLDQPELLGTCLASLAAQTGVRQPYEILVVDNGSKQLPTGVCAAYPGTVLLSETVPGPGPARNRGVSKATGDILAFIDADCRASSVWLSEIERQFADSSVTIIGGDVRIGFEDPACPTLLEAYESVYAYRMKEYIAKQGFTGTGNLAARANVFAAVGKFGGIDIAEDRDWGQRALGRGYQTRYCPDMIVFHPARKTFAELARKWQRHTAHDFARVRARRAWWPRWMLRTAAVALSPAAEWFRIGRSDRLHGIRARLLAFTGLTLIRCYRAAIMLSLAFGASATRMSAQWNPASMPALPRDS
ncbi:MULTISPECIES: glycosyltransferase [unclassified Rhizobium]|uniref:glycosyltransferase n=1 Tax=unclassified Rhizobium TaxID=2613769 RepID=UPI0010465482|nr:MULTISPECIES: glycosyltransferase [unclassified Rhizobium]MBB4170197.1 glycosyltransferase involved in cell wall biosynthesis [Rhizobium sp. BK538]TCM76310.1 glycosyl transferase family 2 [Rhizobium sp. BK068]